MKKHKSKSKNVSRHKNVRKELESKLVTAFNEIVSAFGKPKKADKVIEKFAKQLSKKVSLIPKDDSITAFIKEEEPIITKEKDNVLKAETKTASVKPVKRTKTTKVVS